MNLNILFPNKVYIGQEESFKLGSYIKKFSKKPLILASASFIKSGYYEKIISNLKKENIDYIESPTFSGEPSTEIIDNITNFGKINKVDSVISIGGGSIIDSGKACSAMISNEGIIEDYLEGIGKDKKINNPPLPFFAIPTTSGSGAEATKNSVITSKRHQCKRSFRDERILAKIVILDPILTTSLTKENYFYSALDALSQLIESFISKKSNIFCKSLISYILSKTFNALIELNKNFNDINSREFLSYASFISGVCLANSGLGIVHGFASGIGGLFNIPHGLICAVLLPGACRLNFVKNKLLFDELSLIMQNKDTESFIDFLFIINKKLKIPEKLNISIENDNIIDKIVELSKGSSMNGNPVFYTDIELKEFIRGYFNEIIR